jgi:GxxExxY protein
VHRALGPGLLESTYSQCLCHELYLSGIRFQREYALPVEYRGLKIDCGYRVDILVEERLIAELKAVEAILPVHKAQLLTYLKLSGLKCGLLLDFNVPALKSGITRMVN